MTVATAEKDRLEINDEVFVSKAGHDDPNGEYVEFTSTSGLVCMRLYRRIPLRLRKFANSRSTFKVTIEEIN